MGVTPAAVVVRGPAEALVGNPGPAAARIDPATVGVWAPVPADVGTPHILAVNVDPTAVRGELVVKEVDLHAAGTASARNEPVAIGVERPVAVIAVPVNGDVERQRREPDASRILRKCPVLALVPDVQISGAEPTAKAAIGTFAPAKAADAAIKGDGGPTWNNLKGRILRPRPGALVEIGAGHGNGGVALCLRWV